RSTRDWSSDVCSSDLQIEHESRTVPGPFGSTTMYFEGADGIVGRILRNRFYFEGSYNWTRVSGETYDSTGNQFSASRDISIIGKIGRASCREDVTGAG